LYLFPECSASKNCHGQHPFSTLPWLAEFRAIICGETTEQQSRPARSETHSKPQPVPRVATYPPNPLPGRKIVELAELDQSLVPVVPKTKKDVSRETVCSTWARESMTDSLAHVIFWCALGHSSSSLGSVFGPLELVECSPIDFGGRLGTVFFFLQYGQLMVLPAASSGSRIGVLQNAQLMVNTVRLGRNAGGCGGGMVVCIHSGFRGERPTPELQER
jgi:hypothetical protein